MNKRSNYRDIIVKILYQIYIHEKGNINYDIDTLIKENISSDIEFITTSVKEIIKNQNKIESIANKYLKGWTLDRLSMVDRAIVSLGIYEMKYTDVPNIVCIDEAIELSKKYSDEKVTKMINAILDAYIDEVDNE